MGNQMKQVSGYQAQDGTFFETAEEAVHHEAITELEEAISDWVDVSTPGIDAVLTFIDNNATLIRRYIDARERLNTTDRIDHQDEQGTENDTAPVLE